MSPPRAIRAIDLVHFDGAPAGHCERLGEPLSMEAVCLEVARLGESMALGHAQGGHGARGLSPALGSAIQAFLGPLEGAAQAEAVVAASNGNARRAAVARLAASFSAVAEVGASGMDGLPSQEARKAGFGLDMERWVLRGGPSGEPGAARLAFVGDKVDPLSLLLSGGPEWSQSMLGACADANSRCWPFHPLEGQFGDAGPSLVVDPAIAYACFVASRLAHAKWAMPWAMGAESAFGGPQSGLGEPGLWERAIAPDRLGEGRAPLGDSERGVVLAAGLNAALRLAVGRDDRLRALGSSTLAGLARDGRPGSVARLVERAMEGMGQAALPLAACLARIQRSEMESGFSAPSNPQAPGAGRRL